MRLAFSAVLIAVLAAILWQAVQITGSAAAYPIIVSAGALACSAVLLATQVLRPADGAEVPAAFALPPALALRLVAFGSVWIAYVVLLPHAGFMIATWAALAVSLALTAGRPRIGAVLGTAAFVLVFAVLIKVVLYVPVPQGWPDRQLDTLLYGLR